MTNASTPAPSATTADLPARHLGGLLDLILFLVSTLGLFLLVQFSAVFLLVYTAHQQNPHLAWSELYIRVIQHVQYEAFFIVPVTVVYNALLLLLLYALVSGRRGLPFWSALRVKWLAPGRVVTVLAGGIVLAVLVIYANKAFPPPEELPFDKVLTSRAAALLMISTALLVAPLVEELIFRGYIYTLLERLWGMSPAVLVSGLLFGAVHFLQLWPGVFQIALICLVGVMFSLVRAYTGTTLASILMHLSYNATISLPYLASPQFRNLPPSS